ncbi:sensor histidine kinase [Streptomyces geranii]|uniref:sensor histidine kinase n=1 Tax=Streptomyces geranii TaxID=2058923 RepID=UPI000D0339DA|nr:sensor histidine kinase [Streptomyces geranii]
MTASWQRHPRTVDTAIALLLFAVAFPGSMYGGSDPTAPTHWWPCVLLAGLSCAALPWRRTRPLPVTAVAIGCATGMALAGYVMTALLLAPLMVALYSLAAHAERVTTRNVTLAALVLVAGSALIAEPAADSLALNVIGPVAWLLLPAALGTTARFRGAYLESVHARAEFAERTREEEARHRVGEERMRIARELHDVTAHHLALANAQATTAALLIRSHPAQAEKMVNALGDTTAAALREMKATVGLLRRSDAAEDSLQPAPGLAQLPALVATHTAAGLTVTLTTHGRPQPLSPGADLTAFRIVQEALSNVAKHAHTSTAEVDLTYTHDRLSITVTDQGPGSTAATATVTGTATAPDGGTSGYGLIGMRERALSIGGHLRAGHRPTGGFEVSTELPLHPYAPAEDSTP